MGLFLLFLTIPSVIGFGDKEIIHPLPWEDYVIFTFISIFLVLFGGMMSGLTVGLLSIDELELEMKLSNGTEEEKKMARSVLIITSNHHFLLVTLLLANSLAMEALPLMLDEMLSDILSVVLSVTFVLAFGEVLPQAICTGPEQLKIAYKLTPIIRVIMVLFAPISWPIAKLLDYCIGH